MAEKKFDAQVNYGWGFSFNMTGKVPAVAKRIFDTLSDAQQYIDNVEDTAIEGLVLSVVADTDALNGAYFVQSVGKNDINGVLVKLGSEDYTDTEIQKNAKTYSIAKVEGTELSDLGTNVKEAYKLIDEDNVKAGSYIPVYKDSSLKSVELVSEKPAVGEDGQEGYVPSKQGQFLKFTYLTTEGKDNVVYLDVSSFLAESEFKNGLSVNNNGEVSVKVDATSEGGFLTVSDGGIKLSGVQTAINGEIDKLNATVGSPIVASGKHVAVEVVEENGKLKTLTVAESDIASATGLTAEISRAKAAEKLNADAIAILNGDKTKDGSVAKALSDAKAYTDEEVNAAIITVNTTIDGVTDIVNDISVNIDNVDKKVNNITVNVESLFTKDNSMTGYTLSDLSKKNLYHTNGNTVKFVGYGNSAINPTTNEANLVMESFKDGIRTITIAYIKQNGPTITTQSVKTYSSNAFIMKISQSDYDTMKNAGTLDANTLYVIS